MRSALHVRADAYELHIDMLGGATFKDGLTGAPAPHIAGERLMEHTPMHRVAAASAIGTILEWYDFALYNAMSGLVFNKIFFPSSIRSSERCWHS